MTGNKGIGGFPEHLEFEGRSLEKTTFIDVTKEERVGLELMVFSPSDNIPLLKFGSESKFERFYIGK